MVSNRHGSNAAAEKTVKEMSDEWYSLLFGIRRSIRYHSRREAFFAKCHRVNAFVTVIFGSAAVVAAGDAVKPHISAFVALLPAIIVTVFGAIDLILGFADSARLHADLRRRFIEIESCMVGNESEGVLKKCTRQRLEIEASEPPKKHALDVLCHNELMLAEGYDINDPEDVRDFRQVDWLQRLTANVVTWSATRFPPEEVPQNRG
jgi:hypothetical protein